MKTSVFAAALATVLGVSAVVPAEAMPPTTSPMVNRSTDVQQARTVIRYGYWRGHRGYRYARPGYRRYRDGYWYPLAVFGPTIVIRPARHWRWCGPRHHRYRCVVRY